MPQFIAAGIYALGSTLLTNTTIGAYFMLFSYEIAVGPVLLDSYGVPPPRSLSAGD